MQKIIYYFVAILFGTITALFIRYFVLNNRTIANNSVTRLIYNIKSSIGYSTFPDGAEFGTDNVLILDKSGNLNTNGVVKVGDLYVGKTAYIDSLNLANFLYVAGNEIIDSTGRIPSLTIDYIADLDGSALTNVNANKLDGIDSTGFIKTGTAIDADKLDGTDSSGFIKYGTAIDADKLDGVDSGSFLRSDAADTIAGALTFTAVPGSTSVGGGPLYINPASSSANYTLLGIAVNGTEKFRVDAEGDVTIAGNLDVTGSITGTGSSLWTDAGTYLYPTGGEVLGNSVSSGTDKLTGLYLASSAPLSFGIDNNIGLSFAGSVLAISQGDNDINFDSNTLTIDGSANMVGVGTNSPQALLHAYNNGAAATILVEGSTSYGSRLQFKAFKTWEVSQMASGYQARFQITNNTDSVYALSILPTGETGIGVPLTALPSSRLHILESSAATNSVTNVLKIAQNTSGTATTGFGSGLIFQGESASVEDRDMGRIRTYWETATDATRKSKITFSTYDGTTENDAFTIDGSGNVAIGSTSPAANIKLDVNGRIQINLGGTQTSTALCGSHGSGGTATESDIEIVDCTGTPGADYMEIYPVEDGVDKGTVVALGNQDVVTKDGDNIKQLVRTTDEYQQNVIGIVSDKEKAGDFNSIGYNVETKDNPLPVALVGRVPVKIATSSEEIKPGDYVTSSSESGKAMKAVKAGYVIGKALESWVPGSNKSTIMVFVYNSYYLGNNIALDSKTGSFLSIASQDSTNAESGVVNSNQDIVSQIQKLSGLSYDEKSNILSATSVFKTIQELISEGVATFKNSVRFVSEVIFNGKVMFESKVEFTDKDMAGYVNFKPGTNEVQIKFEKEYTFAPVVQVTPYGDYKLKYWVADVSTKGFTIRIDTILSKETKLSWIAIAIKDPKTYESNSTNILTESPIPTNPLPSLSPSSESTSSSNLDTPESTVSATAE